MKTNQRATGINLYGSSPYLYIQNSILLVAIRGVLIIKLGHFTTQKGAFWGKKRPFLQSKTPFTHTNALMHLQHEIL